MGLDFDLFGRPKIRNLNGAFLSDENVGTFEVSVNNGLFVKVIEPFENLFAKSGSFCFS
jgi:hypothetical protein